MIKFNRYYENYSKKINRTLTPKQRCAKDAIIRFVVKNKNMINRKNYFGEAFLHFDEVEDLTYETEKCPKVFALPITIMSDEGELNILNQEEIILLNFFHSRTTFNKVNSSAFSIWRQSCLRL